MLNQIKSFMRLLITKCLSIFLVLAAFSFSLKAQPAQVQFIHNSADVNLDSVDIYVGDNKEVDDLNFRDATGIRVVEADTQLSVALAPGNSSSIDDTVARTQTTFGSGSTNAIMISGVENPANYAANPDNANIELQFFINRNMSVSGQQDNLTTTVFHGATDVPVVDILANLQAPQVLNNMSYGDYTFYVPLSVGQFADYRFDLRDSDNGNYLHTAYTNLPESLSGQAAIAFASGFADTAANQGGASLALMVALPNGTTFEIPAMETTAHQFIHNVPDPAMETVDVYLNGNLAADNLSFREATNFRSFDASIDTLNVAIAPPNSSDVSDAIAVFSQPVVDPRYIQLANGVSSPGDFAPNPEGRNISAYLSDIPNPMLRGNPNYPGLLTMGLFNSVTDAPDLDINITPNLLGNQFGRIEGFGYPFWFAPIDSITPQEYKFAIYDSTWQGGDNPDADSFYTFERNLSNYADSAMYTTLSGFFDPSANNDGPGMQMIGYLPSGDTVLFQKTYDYNNNTTGSPDIANAKIQAGIFPNPANNQAELSYNLDEQKEVSITLYNNSGMRIEQFNEGMKEAGSYSKNLRVENLESGVYHVEIQTGEVKQNVKLLVQ